MKDVIGKIFSLVKRYFNYISTPYPLREREPLTEEQIDELRKLLEDGFAEKVAKV